MVERLVIGHWPVLVGYGVLPWVIDGRAELAPTGGRHPGWVLVPLGSLSASAGVVTAAVLVAFAVTGSRVGGAHRSGWSSPRTRPGWSPGCCTRGTR